MKQTAKTWSGQQSVSVLTRLFDMTPSVGGVWSHGGVGAYPGAACDVPAYVYLPFLDRTGYIPSRKYVSQQEIANYAEVMTDHCGIWLETIPIHLPNAVTATRSKVYEF